MTTKEFTPVKQRRHNDCVSACVASILNIPIEEVPLWAEMYPPCECQAGEGLLCDKCVDWYHKAVGDFLTPYGVGVLFLGQNNNEEAQKILEQDSELYSIVAHRSPAQKNKGHAVIYKGANLIHDPSQTPLDSYQTDILAIWIFYVAEPWRHVTRKETTTNQLRIDMIHKPKQPYDENYTYMDEILGVPNPKDHEDKPERPGHNPGDYDESGHREELPNSDGPSE